MLVSLGFGREILPETAFVVSTETTGNPGGITSAKTLYFAIQGENSAGLNYLSDISGPHNFTPGGSGKITLTSEAYKSGESWHSIVISASETNNPEDFSQVARVAIADYLPESSAEIELTLDAQF